MIYCNYPSIISAGMVELADTMDLGSIGQPCRFESCYPHQLAASVISLAVSFFISLQSFIARSFCCSSLQNRNHFIGLRFCFSNGKGHFVVRNCDRFAWIRAGKIPQEAFSAWSKEAQKEKVKGENGEINQKIFAMAEAVTT